MDHKRKNGDSKVLIEQQIVYASLLVRDQSQYILGLFSSKEKAINRCLSEVSYSRTGWQKCDIEDTWDNGFGLKTSIKTFFIE
jgi:hypothetical protein